MQSLQGKRRLLFLSYTVTAIISCLSAVSCNDSAAALSAGASNSPAAEVSPLATMALPAAAAGAASPFFRPDGKSFRIAIVRSGDYYFYAQTLASIYNGLSSLGWAMPLKFSDSELGSLQDLLEKTRTGQTYLSFPQDLYVDLDWDENSSHHKNLDKVLAGQADADLVISLGTLAGTFVKGAAQQGVLKVPVLVESASDPVGAGIIKSYEDSGYDLVSASADPEAYARQIKIFYNVVKFKRLGLIYSDTEIGRSYAALKVVRAAAKQFGFEIVPYTDVLEDPPNEKDLPRVEDKYVEGIKTLAPKVDAIYLATQAGLTKNSLPRIVDILDKARVPSFAMEGSDSVRAGVLLGESNNVLTAEGLASARKLIRILRGETPRKLPQISSHTLHVSINLEAAGRIGFTVPVDLLLTADEVFGSGQSQ